MTTVPKPPGGLSTMSRGLWSRMHRGWQLDDSARVLLTVALRAHDRAEEARAIIARDGMVIKAAKGTRAHPAVAVLRDAETSLLRAWRQLGLDVAVPGPLGRPAGSGPA